MRSAPIPWPRDEGKLLEELKPLVGQCVDALRDISPGASRSVAERLRSWTIEESQEICESIYLDTEGVAEIWNTVTHYVGLLGSCLCVSSCRSTKLSSLAMLGFLQCVGASSSFTASFAAASRDNNGSQLCRMSKRSIPPGSDRQTDKLWLERVWMHSGLRVRHGSLDALLRHCRGEDMATAMGEGW